MEKFKKIFSGLTIAYGQYQKGDRGSNGKLKGKAFIVRKNVTDKLWEDHLAGNPPALGIIPIREDNTCKWGCIDVDVYNLKHHSLVQTIRKLKLPLILCRSKSGGAHIFLFTKEFIPASLMQSTLKKISKTFNNSFDYKPSPHLLSSIIKYQNKKYKIEDFAIDSIWQNNLSSKDSFSSSILMALLFKDTPQGLVRK